MPLSHWTPFHPTLIHILQTNNLFTMMYFLLLAFVAMSPVAISFVHPAPRHPSTFLYLATESDERSQVSRTKVLQTMKNFFASSAILTVYHPNAQAYPQPNYSYEGRPTYLTEPTQEFQDNEKRADSFRRDQLRLKQEFKAVVDDFSSTSYSSGREDDATTKKLIADLESMIALIRAQNGLPSGIKKEELYKLIRTKKREGVWPTSCEYTYQALKREISFQQSPNREKDTENPL